MRVLIVRFAPAGCPNAPIPCSDEPALPGVMLLGDGCFPALGDGTPSAAEEGEGKAGEESFRAPGGGAGRRGGRSGGYAWPAWATPVALWPPCRAAIPPGESRT